MSDTPETDAAFQKGMNGKQVFEFAERLERERDEAREAFRLAEDDRIDMARQLESEKSCHAICQNERDEAREALRTLAEHGESEIQRLTKERDEAIQSRKASAADWLSQVQNADLRLKHAFEIAAQTVKEFDEVNCKLADALREVDLRMLDYERMKQERDEAREALKSK